ncbi:MAG: glutamyl-tRNA reductase [Verrucomicrobiae bacterium]|nr:glutamyl-tRNA reductase [Verrucomicrobiae bacterium]
MSILVVGISHRTAPVELRERFALPPARLPEALKALREKGLAQEAVLVCTCNRTELYAHTPAPAPEAFGALLRFFHEFTGQQEVVEEAFYQYAEPQSLEHLFKVAAGLDSMVLGETEILGQLKKAYELALEGRFTGPRLNKAFQRAFNTAKYLRTHTHIQRGSISVASVGVELAEKIFDTLRGRVVMVLGAGDTSEKAARALLSRGAKSVLVSNRSYERAVALAQELGGRAVRFDDWAAEFAAVDIVISSTAAPHYILDRAKLAPLMALRENQPLLLIDLAVPRDIEPEVNFLENVYLYNIDDLQEIAADYLKQRQEEVGRCEAIIRERVRELLQGPAAAQAPQHARPAEA